MLTTNLLPQNEQKNVRLEEVRRTVLFYGISLALILGAGFILLIPSYFLTFADQQELKRSLSIEEEAAQKLNIQALTESIRTAQVVLSSLHDFSATPSRASRIIKEIHQHTGTAITIQRIGVSTDGTLDLQGTAATRRELLAFEEALRSSKLFQDISSPLSNIIKETNISFNIRGRLQPDYSL